ncbi:MAG: AsnC family transcriptional regulator [Candidatus Micrarchaeia archaeon]|jgi:Lrp/AsnC family transcriptional regulator for asnA, asnC and gidA
MQETVKDGGSTARLDKLDWRILYELDCDANQSFANIGKKLKTGRDVILYRVKRLEEIGVIKKYVSIIDYGKIGYLVGALYVKFQHETPEIRNEILEYYKKQKSVWWLLDMSPNYDFAFGWFGKDLLELKNIKMEILKKYRKYFKDFKFRVYNHHYHFKRNYLNPEPQQTKPSPPLAVAARTEKLTDEMDDKILAILSENARKPYVEIANDLKLSAAQVHYKIQQLHEKKVILGARPMLDLKKIGYTLFKLDIYLDDYSVYDEIIKFVFSLPNVLYAYDVIGGADIELDIETDSYENFVKLQDSIKEKFGQAISHTECYEFKKEHKLIYFPQITRSIGREESGKSGKTTGEN